MQTTPLVEFLASRSLATSPLIALTLLGALACSVESTTPPEASASPEEPAAPAARTIVIGVDRSGSYDFLTVGLNKAARLVAEARPGDAVYLRWISGTSYLNEEQAARVRLPEGDVGNCTDNVFDNRCDTFEEALSDFKRTHVIRILALRPPAASNTDIMGFIQAASDTLATVGTGKERLLYLATDLKDNVHHQIQPDLAEVRVVVIALQTDADPETTLQRRDTWRRIFEGYGAAEVRFETPEVTE